MLDILRILTDSQTAEAVRNSQGVRNSQCESDEEFDSWDETTLDGILSYMDKRNL